MMKIAFIGLGNMGKPMAMNLVHAGFNLSVYNRTRSKAVQLNSPQVKIASSPEDAVEDADVLITMLSDDEALHVVSADAIPKMKSGTIHLSMSTVSPSVAEGLQALHRQHAVCYVAAPVMGRPAAAEAKMLFILLSGDAASKQKLKPVLESLGQRIFDFGESPAAAHAAKLALNLMIFTHVELLSEVMLFAEKSGLDKNVLLETITNTQLSSPAIKLYGELILREQDNTKGFATRLANKDVTLAMKAAEGHGLHLPLAHLIAEHFNESINQGNGEKDVSLLIAYLREKLARK